MNRCELSSAINRRTCSPPGGLKRANGVPHLVVASMMRSGTHIVIDLLLNNFQAYKGSPLYVNLDMLVHRNGSLDQLAESGGSVIKTHFPQTIECRGHEQEITSFLQKQNVILVTRDPEQIKHSLKRFGSWGAEEVSRFDVIQHEFDDYWMKNHEGEVLRLDYSDLIQPEKLPELLQRIADFTGLPKSRKPLGVIDKNKRFSILLCKAMTRSLGRFAPRINTGIKLGS